MTDKKERRRALNIMVPGDEAQIVIDEAERLNISITMVLRMLIREHLLNDPITFLEKD